MEKLGLYYKYIGIYDNGINADEATIIVKTEDYPELKQKLSKYILSRGYTKVIFEDPGQGFIVLAKEGLAPSFQIILKYTKTSGTYKTRIDLVRGSDDLNTESAVNEDIQEIAKNLNDN